MGQSGFSGTVLLGCNWPVGNVGETRLHTIRIYTQYDVLLLLYTPGIDVYR